MLNNISLLLKACKNLNISYEILHPSENLIKIKLNSKQHYFCNYSTPLLNQAVAHLIKDKEYTYHVLNKKVNLPRTVGFLSPFCDSQYKIYLKFPTIPDIVLEIKENFETPVIIKRNSGAGGHNVFLCDNLNEIETALKEIFTINNKYDYVALAQEFIHIKSEYRAVFLNKELVLLYEKDITDAKFVGNLSPLHWDGAKAKYINDPQILSEITNFAQPVFQELDIDYGGFDIVLDRDNQYWLIEINSHPNFSLFIRDNGEEPILRIFEKMLISLASN
ncbi:ATP-grasp domain-containing protein [Nostoc sp. 'Lobaria pulmonaria (5183) cyanobiont']|uniref:ATP-grasp domain-containing protein n=1 Tax=Nostoc sp. 'Lobaria pulmonaria (5183) cyanobiont' TaxID=1618022 RepID=UPI000CF33623|nr:YheC/YheD family protein [Nostoc sp. 'Lobaria pulmonaria (5183) cyanobiont']AVH70752.1 alpha-L-glutamate ligase [Nostoc sp. 'Lobaria pulmonaria (5183) cyanobiont']